MHEGTVVREIMDIVSESAIQNQIKKVYEIVLRIGPYSCINERQLNWYFEILRQETCMEEAVILLEKDESLTGVNQMYIKTFKGE